jgi:hypothetical protein
MPTPQQQLNSFINRYDLAIAKLAQAALKKMRHLLPGSVELVYDNYNTLAIGFGPSEKAGQALFSIALYPKWVSLYFFLGSRLDDPHKLLQGSGKLIRHIRLTNAKTLDSPTVLALIEQSLDLAPVPIDVTKPSSILIASISKKQRPRRPTKS